MHIAYCYSTINRKCKKLMYSMYGEIVGQVVDNFPKL